MMLKHHKESFISPPGVALGEQAALTERGVFCRTVYSIPH
jgi:hypothetical protein